MMITSKGQVTIPQDIRDRFGFLPHTEVEFVIEGRTVRLRKAETRSSRTREWVRKYRGSLKGGMSTDELMQLTRGEEP